MRPLAPAGQPAHDRRLDERHERHVAVGADRDRPEQLGREAAAHVDRRRAVDRADDADRGGLVEREAERQREHQRAEDPELAGGAEQHQPRVLEQRAEVGHRADADEDQQREQLVADAHAGRGCVSMPVGLDERRERQVGEDGAGADRQQQHRLVVLRDRQVDEQAAGRHHDGGAGRQVREARQQQRRASRVPRSRLLEGHEHAGRSRRSGPGWTRTSATTPSRGALIAFTIFMASSFSSTCPVVTASPAFTSHGGDGPRHRRLEPGRRAPRSGCGGQRRAARPAPAAAACRAAAGRKGAAEARPAAGRPSDGRGHDLRARSPSRSRPPRPRACTSSSWPPTRTWNWLALSSCTSMTCVRPADLDL